MSAMNEPDSAHCNQETLLVGGPKDGQWVPPLGESVGERVFFPVAEHAAAELMSEVHGPSPAYFIPPYCSHVAYDKIKLQLLTSYGRSEIAHILFHKDGSWSGFDATEFLRKLLESYGEPKSRWRKPTPEDGGFGRYYYVKDEVDEYTTENWHEPIQIHQDNDGRWLTYRPVTNRPLRMHFFSKKLEVCECVRQTK